MQSVSSEVSWAVGMPRRLKKSQIKAFLKSMDYTYYYGYY